MVSFKWVVALILAVSFMVFVTFFGRLPALRRTPIGALHRLIWIHIPNFLLALDNRLTSGKISRSLSRFGNFMMHDRHPTVVIFFLIIMVAGEYLYLPAVWYRIGSFTKLTVAITVFLPYYFLYRACASDPGYITPQNHAYYMSLYPYDHALFHPGNECSTCGFLKPARSKHCSICKHCIAKADHHCVFINSCVGYGNQHYFILLLLATAVLTTYGSLLGLSLLSASGKEDFPDWSVWHPSQLGWGIYVAVWGWTIQKQVQLGATTLLSMMTSPLVWGLFCYTLYLVYGGTTTNESLKWSMYKEDTADGYAFRRNLPATRDRDAITEPICSRWPVEPVMVLAATEDGNFPREQMRLAGDGDWERVWKMKDVENLYDLGFWDNLVDVFVKEYAFGARVEEPLSERKRYAKRAATSKPSAFPP